MLVPAFASGAGGVQAAAGNDVLRRLAGVAANEWSLMYGVVIMLADDAPVRLEFLRDRR